MKEYKNLDEKQQDLILALMGSVEYAKGNVTAILPFTNGTPEHLVREFCMFHADDVIRGARKLVPNSGKSAMDIVTHFIVSSGKKPRQDPDLHTAEGWNAKDFDGGLKTELVDLARGNTPDDAPLPVSQEAPQEKDPEMVTPPSRVEKKMDLKSMVPVAVPQPRRGRPPKTQVQKKKATPAVKRKEKKEMDDGLKGKALLEAVLDDAKKVKEAATPAVEEMKKQGNETNWVETDMKPEFSADQAKIGDGVKEHDPQAPKADDWIPDPPPKLESKERTVPYVPYSSLGMDTFIKNMNDMLKPRRPASLIDYRPLLVAVMDRIGSGEMQITNLRVDETIGSITIDYRRIPA